MAEIKLFYIFICSVGFDLLIGDPRFIIHPVQIIGFYIKQITNFFIHYFKNNKRILFGGGLFIALSSIGISFVIGKFIELVFIQSKGNLIFGILIFFGLASCLASKSLTSSVKEISRLINNNIINQKNEKIVREKVQRIVSRDVSSSSLEHLLSQGTVLLDRA